MAYSKRPFGIFVQAFTWSAEAYLSYSLSALFLVQAQLLWHSYCSRSIASAYLKEIGHMYQSLFTAQSSQVVCSLVK